MSAFNSNDASCGDTEILGIVQQIMNVALEGVKLLGSTGPKSAQVATINANYNVLLVQYNQAVQKFILTNNKSCYDNLRVRTSPLTITDAVIGILTKCIQYVDASNIRC